MKAPPIETHPCTLGGGALGTTIAAGVLGVPFLAIFFAVIPWLMFREGKYDGWPILVLADLGLVAIVAAIYALSPRRYEFHPHALLVRRRSGAAIEYPWSTIQRAEIVRPSPVVNAERTGANGGIFGYYGYFQNLALKNFEAHATTDEWAVVLHREKGGAVVLSPDRPEEFVAAVELRIGPR